MLIYPTSRSKSLACGPTEIVHSGLIFSVIFALVEVWAEHKKLEENKKLKAEAQHLYLSLGKIEVSHLN